MGQDAIMIIPASTATYDTFDTYDTYDTFYVHVPIRAADDLRVRVQREQNLPIYQTRRRGGGGGIRYKDGGFARGGNSVVG